MKAPDKIYACTTDVRGQKEQIWLSYPLSTTGNVEYIRKDALLEWAKGQKAWLKQGFKKDWKNEDTLNGGRLMLDKLINKLNSM